MLQASVVSTNGTSLATNEIVNFNTVLDTDCRVANNNGTINIDKPGRYLIQFNSVGYNTGEATTPDASEGTYSFQLFNNGVAVSNAFARATSTANTAIANVSFETILTVNRSCCVVDNDANLTVQYLGQAGTMYLANIIITKLN